MSISTQSNNSSQDQNFGASRIDDATTVELRNALDKFSQDGNAADFLLKLRELAREQGGMSYLSKKVGINRQNLYRTFASTGNPKFRSLNSILKGLGFKLTVERIGASNDDTPGS